MCSLTVAKLLALLVDVVSIQVIVPQIVETMYIYVYITIIFTIKTNNIHIYIDKYTHI